jgi:tRNA/rRNA methyltransferase
MIMMCICFSRAFRIHTHRGETQGEARQLCFSGYGTRTSALESKKDAYEFAKQDHLRMPVFVLVEPFSDMNIGSVARYAHVYTCVHRTIWSTTAQSVYRAMLNFGCWELRLVNPRCNHLSGDAHALAAGGAEVLRHAQVFTSTKEAVADMQQVLAATARPRSLTHLVYTPEAAAEALLPSNETEHRCCILFGPERSGLCTEDVSLASGVISIPTFPHFQSINLAQAVNIVAYDVYKRRVDLANTGIKGVRLQQLDRFSRRDELDMLLERFQSKLEVSGFQKDAHKREMIYSSLRILLQRAMVTKAEVDLLHGVMNALSCIREKGSKEKLGPGDQESELL